MKKEIALSEPRRRRRVRPTCRWMLIFILKLHMILSIKQTHTVNEIKIKIDTSDYLESSGERV